MKTCSCEEMEEGEHMGSSTLLCHRIHLPPPQPDHPSARPPQPLLSPWDPKNRILRIKISLTVIFRGHGPPEIMSFHRFRFFIIFVGTCFCKNCLFWASPGLGTIKNQISMKFCYGLTPYEPLRMDFGQSRPWPNLGICSECIFTISDL